MPHLKLFLLALSFYTRLPHPQTLDYKQLPQAAVYLPLIGWLVGGICALVFYLADLLWPQTTAVILALIAGILLTGALHEDGFADVCDGFGGGMDKQRILEIMKDSHIGVYGFLGLLLMLLLKISVLSAMPAAAVPLVLLAGHSISRLSPLLLMQRYELRAWNMTAKPRARFINPISGNWLLLPPSRCCRWRCCRPCVRWQSFRYCLRPCFWDIIFTAVSAAIPAIAWAQASKLPRLFFI